MRILLNGFKRLRCARKLHLHTAPFVSLGTDEASGIVCLLRAANDHALSLLEQARFLDELKAGRGLSVAEIAQQLSRSKAGVSLRLADLEQAQKVLLRVMTKSQDPRLSSRPCRAQAQLLCAGLFSRVPAFTKTLPTLYDHSGQT